MQLNNDCVRSLLLWLEQNQTVSSSGSPDPVMLRKIYGSFPNYSAAEIHVAATYLVQKKLVSLRAGQTPQNSSPRGYVISGITATGYDFIAAVRNETVWQKILSHLGDIALASVPTVIELASKLL